MWVFGDRCKHMHGAVHVCACMATMTLTVTGTCTSTSSELQMAFFDTNMDHRKSAPRVPWVARRLEELRQAAATRSARTNDRMHAAMHAHEQGVVGYWHRVCCPIFSLAGSATERKWTAHTS